MPFLRLIRQRLVEVCRSNRDVVDTLSLLGEEARVVALVVERLDQLPLHPADHGGREPPGAFDRPSLLVQILRAPGVELVDVPRPDPVIVDVSPHRRFDVAHDDPDLERLVERRLAHLPSTVLPISEEPRLREGPPPRLRQATRACPYCQNADRIFSEYSALRRSH